MAAADPFFVDRVGPARSDDVVDAELDLQVPKRERIEDVGVEQDDGRRPAVTIHGP
jgi:hypothetical protein